jgi:hypothetical protein
VAKSKKNSKSKSSVQVRDMKAKKDPKGGAYDAFLKIDGIKSQPGEITVTPPLVSSLNFKK